MCPIQQTKSTCLLLFFLISLVSCSGQSGLSNKEERVRKLSDLISTYSEYGEFNGAVLVATEGEVLYKKGFGLANMEWDIPNQSNTKFRIGSITKQFTAMLIVQLVEEGKLDLHTPISNFLPEYPAHSGDRITIHHLLTHSSGIPNSYEETKSKPFKPDNFSAEELVAEFSALELEFKPGERFSYCNAGYTLLGYLIESVTGKSFEESLKQQILGPLNMANTGFDKHRQLSKNRASGYFENWGDYYNANYIDMSAVFAAGAMYSTVEDLFLWDQALYTDKLLTGKYRDLLFTPHIPDPGYGGYYGYGWSIKDKALGNTGETIQTIGHDGVIDGFCAVFTRIPSTQSSIVLLSNIRRAPLNAMTKGIMGILHDKNYDLPKKSLAYSLLDVIDEQGINEGLKFYKTAKNDVVYYLMEDEINMVSYKLLQSDRAEEAAEVLKLGIEAFPEAFNLYDSYGEILRVLGDKIESLRNYSKSVELNPENENGLKMIRELEAEISQGVK